MTAAGLLVFVLTSPASAFHDGGVATCGGCHIMSETRGGSPTVALGGSQLISENSSDLCLLCHASAYGEVLGDDPLVPPPEKGAGNFAFLVEDNLNDAPDGASQPIPGEAAGHNVVAPGFGLVADARWGSSPGGGYPAGSLSCTSCHDPHGSQAFRFLRGIGPVDGGAFTFAFSAPQAEGIDVSTESEADDNHTAYQAGMSDWCGNCHGRYHEEGFSDFDHPSGEILEADIRQRYNDYAGDDYPGQGFPDKAYLAAVPFEDGMAETRSRKGPNVSSRVMCLTCHRAHASSAPSAGRWDFNIDFLQNDGLVSGSWPIPSPYSSPTQGSLCAKCHLGAGDAEEPSEALPREIPNLDQSK